jgi:hypothetical protein
MCDEDISMLKVNELYSWFNVWQFMERCEFTDTDQEGVDGEGVG